MPHICAQSVFEFLQPAAFPFIAPTDTSSSIVLPTTSWRQPPIIAGVAANHSGPWHQLRRRSNYKETVFLGRHTGRIRDVFADMEHGVFGRLPLRNILHYGLRCTPTFGCGRHLPAERQRPRTPCGREPTLCTGEACRWNVTSVKTSLSLVVWRLRDIRAVDGGKCTTPVFSVLSAIRVPCHHAHVKHFQFLHLCAGPDVCHLRPRLAQVRRGPVAKT